MQTLEQGAVWTGPADVLAAAEASPGTVAGSARLVTGRSDTFSHVPATIVGPSHTHVNLLLQYQR